MTSSWSMAFRSLARRKTRTALTVSGIIIGVAMILVLLSLAAGTSGQAVSFIRNLSDAQITVVNGTTAAPSTGGFSGFGGFGGGGNGSSFRSFFGSANTVNASLVNTIGNLSGVYEVSPSLSTTGYIDGSNAFLYGIDPSTYSTVTGGLTIISGTNFQNISGNQIILGDTLAQDLGVSAGSTVTVGANSTGGVSYTVVGIFSTGNTFEERAGYISLSNAQSLSGDSGLVSDIYVKATTTNVVNLVASEISSEISGVRVITADSASSTAASSLSGTLTTFFTVIGLVALLAGGFGAINTMMISVSERTREVGTLRAIGATKGQIMKIFMSEAFLIGLAGAVAGVFIGIIVSVLLPSLTGAASSGRFGSGGFGGAFRGALMPNVTPEILGISLLLGLFVGILAGIYPAWRAAKMNPVEALRHV